MAPEWLRYAWKWLDETEPKGHFEMPGSRIMTPGSAGGARWNWANDSSAACPAGSGNEAVIRSLWGTQSTTLARSPDSRLRPIAGSTSTPAWLADGRNLRRSPGSSQVEIEAPG